MTATPKPWAVLISGGLDSAILVGDALARGHIVHPIFIRCGLAWEDVELAHLRRFLAALHRPSLKPLTILDQPVADLYGPHWSITGVNVPGATDPDEMVFLPGRNVLLLSKAILWCHLNRVPVVALGSLMTNPFPDATPAFFEAFSKILNQAVGGDVKVAVPFAGMKKVEVMRLGRMLPLEQTFSCMQQREGLHCGRCNKCAERIEAFRSAGMIDPTRYGV